MDDKNREAWEAFLDPDVLRPNLIIASLYIAAFELLRSSIVDRIKSFYSTGFDQNGPRIGADYESEVSSRNRSPVYASLEWLKENGATDDNDLAIFEQVKECRNRLAHEIVGLLSNGIPPDLPMRFADMTALIDKIEKWWIVNVEIPINPDFDGQEIDEQGIMCGPVIALKALIDIALGSEEDSKRYLNEFLKKGTGKPSIN